MHSDDQPETLALRALREFRQGALHAGTQHYRQALATGAYRIPVGVHLMHLRGLGLDEAAARVELAALEGGGDLSVTWGLRRYDAPAPAAREYEGLLGQGRMNAVMMHRYMVCLSRLGDSARLAAMASPEHLLYQSFLPASEWSSERLAQVLATITGSSQRTFGQTEYAARQMDRVHRTHRSGDPGLVNLHQAIRDHVKCYLAKIAQVPHPMVPLVPRQFALRSWAVISTKVGHLEPHIHSGCWVCGVVYLSGLERGDAAGGGALRIGASPDGDSTCAGWPQVRIVPTPGRIVVMPSFYTHWVDPVVQSLPRVSVAFNVVWEDAGDVHEHE